MADEAQSGAAEHVDAAARPSLERGSAELPAVRVDQSLAVRISALMLAVVLATGASALLILGQTRELRASHDLLTAVYVPFQEQLTEAHVMSAKISAQVAGATRNPQMLAQIREGDLALLSDALAERSRLVTAIKHPLEQALQHPDRVGGQDRLEAIRALQATVGELERLVSADEGLDPLEALQDTSHQAEVDELFRNLGESAHRAVRKQRDEVDDAAARTEQLTGLVTSAGVLLAALATLAVVLTLRPLRRLSQGVRQLGRGDWGQRVELGSADAGRDDEVSRLAREFNLMADALEERERRIIRGERLAAVGQLASQITHEIRNPLSSVALNVELLEEEVGRASPEARELFSRIGAEVDRLTAITEAYLGFARRPEPVLARFDLARELDDLLQFLAEEHELAGLGVVREIRGPAFVMGDAAQLRRTLMNLLRNAREAVEDAVRAHPGHPARIRVAAACKDGRVSVVVEDSGMGIALPPEQLDRIFEAFFTDKAKGTGLGLSTVQEIVNDHGGTIRVLSTGADGTAFELSLPACDPTAASVSSPNPR